MNCVNKNLNKIGQALHSKKYHLLTVFEQILADSLSFSRKELGTAFKKIKPFAEHEFTQFAENDVFLAKLKLTGTIDDEELKNRLLMQKSAVANVLLPIKGIGLVTAQKLVNGVLGIISKAIKKSINVVLRI